MAETPSEALSRMRVLDLTRVRAGPTCTRILADFGADVIRIEPLTGADPNENMSGPRDGYDNQNLHRNKRSMGLNLKRAEGRALFLRLAADADVVVENFRPGVMARLGLDWETLEAANPRLILCSISGYGQTGPYAQRPAFDQVIQGIGGMMSITGRPDQGPMRTGIAVADSSAGLYAAIGVLVAVAERERSGRGQWVQTSLLEAQVAMLDFQAARYLVDGVVPEQIGNDHPYVSPMGVFRTADGMVNIGVSGEGLWARFCAALPELGLEADPRFASQISRCEHRAALNGVLEAAFATRTSAELLDLFDLFGVPSGPINSIKETFEDPQVRHLALSRPVEHPVRGEMALLREPVTLSRTPRRHSRPRARARCRHRRDPARAGAQRRRHRRPPCAEDPLARTAAPPLRRLPCKPGEGAPR